MCHQTTPTRFKVSSHTALLLSAWWALIAARLYTHTPKGEKSPLLGNMRESHSRKSMLHTGRPFSGIRISKQLLKQKSNLIQACICDGIGPSLPIASSFAFLQFFAVKWYPPRNFHKHPLQHCMTKPRTSCNHEVESRRVAAPISSGNERVRGTPRSC